MTVDPQGQKASLNGAKFEDLMEHQVCEILGIEARKFTDKDAPEDVLWKNVPYESIYGTNCRSEFLLKYKGRKIRIECKYQEAKGSVDEKLWRKGDEWLLSAKYWRRRTSFLSRSSDSPP